VRGRAGVTTGFGHGPSAQSGAHELGVEGSPDAAGDGGGGHYAASRGLPTLVRRAKNILLTPKTEWPVIAAEPTSIGQLYGGYVAPMAGFAAVMSFIRMSVVGVNVPFGGMIRMPVASGLVSSAVTFVLGLIGLYLVGFIINLLAPSFSGARDQRQAQKIAAYALTPAWLGTAFTFLPTGGLLQLLAGVYGICLLYLGLPLLMRTRRQNAAGYTASVVVCTLLIGILFGVIGAALGGAAHTWGVEAH
jgi:Yip1 domain